MMRQRTVRCTHCLRAHRLGAWTKLALIERLQHEHVRDLLTQWPWRPDDVLEVRRCECGHDVALLTRCP